MEVLSLESVDSTETREEGSTALNLYSVNGRVTGSKRSDKGLIDGELEGIMSMRGMRTDTNIIFCCTTLFS